MCGIIGINSNKPVSSTIISSLKKLEYRGYDSAGIATLTNNEINEVKSEGRVNKLESNPRLSFMKKNLKNMDESRRELIFHCARQFIITNCY